jgi:hypothetical protein|tara:strand:+ start:5084 stop:5941 length:858 start_codon:yes stop_codon:yes gene_type:complete
MSNNIRNIIRSNRRLFSSILVQSTDGNLTLQDDECFLSTQGSFKSIFIEFKGNVGIINNLPDGYGISFIKNVIHISNILGRNMKEDNPIFRIKNNFEILSAHIYNWEGRRIELDIIDKNKEDFINFSESNFEDSTLIIGQANIPLVSTNTPKRNTIDDNSVKGLYANNPLPNGYTGYYHYYPDEKVYMTGKYPSNTSAPILIGKSSVKNTEKINKIAQRVKLRLKASGLDVVSLDKSDNIKPVKNIQKDINQVSKYESVLPQKSKEKKLDGTITKTSSDVKKGSY